MKTIAILPMRHSSERVKGKNYRPLGGRPLYHWIVSTLLEVEEIDSIIIDTDSDFIRADAAEAYPQVEVVERPAHLRAGEIAMNDVLLNTVSGLDCDAILQTHSTNPFLSTDTIRRAFAIYEAGNYDSVFGVTRLQARLWKSATTPLNHDPSVLLRTQDLDPVYLENSTVYLFEKKGFLESGNRIGARPGMVEVDFPEAVDIDEERDFSFAQLLAQTRVGASE